MNKEAKIGRTLKSRLIEDAIGAGVGATIGATIGATKPFKHSEYLDDKEDTSRHRRLRAVLSGASKGAIIGGIGTHAILSGTRQCGRSASKFSDFGIKQNSFKTKKDFDKWYKDQVRMYHPDANKSPDAAKKMQNINAFADSVKKSNWYEKLAYLKRVDMQKTAGLGATLATMGSKALSAATKFKASPVGSQVISAGKAAWNNPISRNAIKGATTGAVVGAISSQPDENGKSHRLRNALIGGTVGGTVGAGFGTSTQFAPQIKNFGNTVAQQVKVSAGPMVQDVAAKV